MSRSGSGPREHPLANKNFISNATNLSHRVRDGLVGLFADYGARVRIVYLEAPAADQHRRNAARRDPLPESAIDRMLAQWQPPLPGEAHRVDWIDTTA